MNELWVEFHPFSRPIEIFQFFFFKCWLIHFFLKSETEIFLVTCWQLAWETLGLPHCTVLSSWCPLCLLWFVPSTFFVQNNFFWCFAFFFCFLSVCRIFANRNSAVVFAALFLAVVSVVFVCCFCAFWGAVSLAFSCLGLVVISMLHCEFFLRCFCLFSHFYRVKLCFVLLCFCRYVCVCCLFSVCCSVCFFAWGSFCPFLWSAFALTTCPLCASVTRLTSLVPHRQVLFLVVFWLFGRTPTIHNDHQWRFLTPFRALTPHNS